MPAQAGIQAGGDGAKIMKQRLDSRFRGNDGMGKLPTASRQTKSSLTIDASLHRTPLHVPDVGRIFGNRAVTGEFSRAGHIQERLAGPCRRVGIKLAQPRVRLEIGLEIGEMHVIVAVHQPRVAQRGAGSVMLSAVIFLRVGALRRLLCRFHADRCVLFAGMLASSAISPSDIVG
jgi:hypothetical protein